MLHRIQRNNRTWLREVYFLFLAQTFNIYMVIGPDWARILFTPQTNCWVHLEPHRDVLQRVSVRLYLHLHKRTAARGKMRKWFKLTKHRRRSHPWNRSFPVLRTCEVDFLTLCAVSKTTVWICMMWFRAVILKIAILAREIQPTCCSTLLFERCSYSAWCKRNQDYCELWIMQSYCSRVQW